MQVILLRKRKSIALATIILLASMTLTLFGSTAIFAAKPQPLFLDPKIIPKYTNQLVVPPVFEADTPGGTDYTVKMVNTFRQKILPTLPPGTLAPIPGDPSPADGLTSVWGYQGNAIAKGKTLGVADGSPLSNFVWSPSATFEAVKDAQVTVKWVNEITAKQPFAVDPTLYWANPWKFNPLNTYYDSDKAFPDGDAFSKTGAVGGAFLPFPPGYDGTGPFPPYSLNAQFPVPLVPHLHGAEVMGEYDGGPESWWTAAGAGFADPTKNLVGPNYRTAQPTPTTAGQAWYQYPNSQEPTTLWYHDHALGITRLNVMSGLAGYYLLRDGGPVASGNTLPPGITDGQLFVNTLDGLLYTYNLATTTWVATQLTVDNLDTYLTTLFPYGVSEIPLCIQDRTFKTNGELWFPEAGLNPTIHPYWMPEFFGNTIMVNGLVWPNLDVTPGWYRFRLLDGSNARFYTMSFDNRMPFTVIGSDGGYLQSHTTVNSITIAPGERADILVQFTPAMIGQKIILKNTAKGPYPNGANPDPRTTGQIMQFTVKANTDPTWTNGVKGATFSLANLPAKLNRNLQALGFPTMGPGTIKKYITLNEVMGPAGPIMVMINGQYYHGQVDPVTGQGPTGTLDPLKVAVPAGTAPYTSVSVQGTTEEWVIINLTADTHPIHLHLVTFQLVSRQPFQAGKYLTAWLKQQVDPITLNPLVPPFPEYYEPFFLDPTPYLQQAPLLTTAFPTEMGWKDTIQMHPGEVTTIRVRFTDQAGGVFPFNVVDGPGYVYHCHIIDHEDNEMMRPLIVQTNPPI